MSRRQDTPDGESVTRLVLRTVRRSPGLTSAALAERMGRGTTSDTVSRICQRMQQKGAVVNLAPARSARALWWPTDVLRRHGEQAFVRPNCTADTLRLIREGLEDMSAIAARLGCHRETVRAAVHRLTAAGLVVCQRHAKATVVRPNETPLEDDGWTPQPYVHPIRQRALGQRAA